MKAIDTHVHPGTKEDVIDCGGKYIAHAFQYFGKKIEVLTEEALAERYQSLDIMGVLFAGSGKRHEDEEGFQRVHRRVGEKISAHLHRFCRRGSLERKSGDPGSGSCDPRSGFAGSRVPAGR